LQHDQHQACMQPMSIRDAEQVKVHTDESYYVGRAVGSAGC
jgi:hypothetical protein